MYVSIKTEFMKENLRNYGIIKRIEEADNRIILPTHAEKHITTENNSCGRQIQSSPLLMTMITARDLLKKYRAIEVHAIYKILPPN